MNNMNYVFDVDGTLTESRLPIDPEFKQFFLTWARGKRVYLVTGSDEQKTMEQVGVDLWRAVTKVFQCCGNSVFKKGRKIFELSWHPEPELLQFLSFLLGKSEFPERSGNHIEVRTGLVNFSSIGRDCTQAQRLAYNAWDIESKEREIYCEAVMGLLPHLSATVGGQISIDIYPKGKDKGQLFDLIHGPICFFGDKTFEGGNDYPLAHRLQEKPNQVYQVSGPEETRRIIETIGA